MFGFKRWKDNRGLSLVELVCALAILGVITTTVGGAMAVATNSYRRGTVETSLQQEAQFTTNHIESLIIDATKEVKWSTSEVDGVATKELIILNDDKAYKISFNSSTNELRYTEYNASKMEDVKDANVIADAQNLLLAEHVSDFTADASRFDEARTVFLKLDMQNGSSKYTSSYNVTSRNNPNVGAPLTESASLRLENNVYIEPGHDFLLSVTVMGSNGTLSASMSADDDDGGLRDVASSSAITNAKGHPVSGSNPTCTEGDKTDPKYSYAVSADGGVKIHLGVNETGGADAHRTVVVSLKNSAGEVITSETVNVYVRRVREVKISGNRTSGAAERKAGCVYTLQVADSDFNPARTSYLDDSGTLSDRLTGYLYKNPRRVRWEVVNSTYAKILTTDRTSNVIQVELLQDIPADGAPYDLVKAISLHADGQYNSEMYNKKGIDYDDVFDTFTLTVPRVMESTIQRGRMTDIFAFGNESGAGTNKVKSEVTGVTWEGTRETKNFQIVQLTEVRAYYRFMSQDSDHKSAGFNEGYWYLTSSSGGLARYSGDAFAIDSDLFTATGKTPTKYMEDYKLQLLYCLKYKVKYTFKKDDGNWQDTEIERWWPEFLNDTSDTVGAQFASGAPNTITGLKAGDTNIEAEKTAGYMGDQDMSRVRLNFEGVGTGFSLENYTTSDRPPFKSATGVHINDSVAVQVTADGEGLGTRANPIPMCYALNGGWQGCYQIVMNASGAWSNKIVQGDGSLVTSKKIYDVTDASNPVDVTNTMTINYTGSLYGENGTTEVFNYFSIAGNGIYNNLQDGHIYKMVLDSFAGYDGTNPATEHYADESTGRGIVYFKFHN